VIAVGWLSLLIGNSRSIKLRPKWIRNYEWRLGNPFWIAARMKLQARRHERHRFSVVRAAVLDHMCSRSMYRKRFLSFYSTCLVFKHSRKLFGDILCINVL
jgi:hypothetical protein